MTHIRNFGMVLAAAAAFSAVGCCQKEKDQIASLTRDYQDLSRQNNDLRTQLAQAKAREAELAGQIDAYNLQLASKEQEIAGLKKPRPVEQPQQGITAPGWEKGLTGDKVTVGTDILFAAGKAALTDAGKAALDKIASDLRTTYSGLPVRVYGYTDSDPIRKTKTLWADNLDLSANRAMAVTRHLISKGIRSDEIETVAMGETHPAASNATADGKKKNRRVEIVVIKQ